MPPLLPPLPLPTFPSRGSFRGGPWASATSCASANQARCTSSCAGWPCWKQTFSSRSSSADFGPAGIRPSSDTSQTAESKGATWSCALNLPPKAPGAMLRVGKPAAAKGPSKQRLCMLSRKSSVKGCMQLRIWASSLSGEPKRRRAMHSCCVALAQLKTYAATISSFGHASIAPTASSPSAPVASGDGKADDDAAAPVPRSAPTWPTAAFCARGRIGPA
mmetsp:Transcript_28353/g.94120  ORF Transcript_28353/g.94120 Transcript_28353/m.94120 type:complete len:219 (-) Transcript_28353:777-1433(-)